MKKFSSSAQMLTENLKTYLKRAGIAAVTVSLGLASVITLVSDEAKLSSKAKSVSVAEVNVAVIEDTKVEYSKIEYSDLQADISESEQMAKVEKTGQEAGAVALAADEEEEEETGGKTVHAVLTSKTEATTQATTSAATTTTIQVENSGYESGTYIGTYVTTAYCGCSKCCGKSNGITASGTKATQGRTIAAPSSFAFGTELIINGHTYVVEDRGSAITGNRIDIYFTNHSDALAYGRKTVKVYAK